MIRELILEANNQVSKECDKEIRCKDCKFNQKINGELLCFIIYDKYKNVRDK